MSLRIAILGQFPFDDAPPVGGVQSVIANLRDELSRRADIELHLIQNRRGAPAGTFRRAGWIEHNLDARETRIIPNMLRTPGLLRPALEALAPDVISSHQPEYAAAALKMGFPVLHTIHGFPGQEFWTRRGVFTRAATLWEVWQERQTLRRARHLVAISDMVIQRYQNRTRARFHRINNPIAPLFFRPAPQPEPFRVLLVGHLNKRKGVDIAIGAMMRLRPAFPRLTLDIVGRTDVEPEFTRQVRDMAAPLGDAVRFLGPTDQTGIRAAMERAQVLLLTSRMENAPMVIAEAMATGRPVVATRVGGVASMVQPGRTGYLAPSEDPQALADGLARLLSNAAHAAELGANAARFARENYHPTAVADGYLHALREVMGA